MRGDDDGLNVVGVGSSGAPRFRCGGSLKTPLALEGPAAAGAGAGATRSSDCRAVADSGSPMSASGCSGREYFTLHENDSDSIAKRST